MASLVQITVVLVILLAGTLLGFSNISQVYAVGPDWIVEKVYLGDPNVKPGYKTKIWAVIKNVGDAETNDSYVRYYINGGLFFEQTIGDRNAGSGSTESSKLWEYPGGTATIQVCIDPYNTTPESNENNNCTSIQVGSTAPVEKIATTLDLSVCPASGSGYDCTKTSVTANTNVQVKIQGMLKKTSNQDGLSGKSIQLSYPGGSATVTTSSYGGYEHTVTINISGSGTFSASYAGDTTYKSASNSKTLSSSSAPPPPPPPPSDPTPTPPPPEPQQDVAIRLRSDSDDGRKDIGKIVFDGTSYSLPVTIYKPAGTYSIQASPSSGYVFKEWDSISPVSSRGSPSTTAKVSGSSVIIEMELRTEPTYGSFHFDVSASPSSASIKAGEAISFSIPVTHTSGPSELVSLSLNGMPSDVGRHSFSTNHASPTFTSKLTISTYTSAPVGTYNLEISGSGGGETKHAKITLKIASQTSSSSNDDAIKEVPPTPPAVPSTPSGRIEVDQDVFEINRYSSTLVTIKGIVENAQRDESVKLMITKPGGDSEEISILPTKDGNYRTAYLLDEEAKTGTYTIRALYKGSSVGTVSFSVIETYSPPQIEIPQFEQPTKKVTIKDLKITGSQGIYTLQARLDNSANPSSASVILIGETDCSFRNEQIVRKEFFVRSNEAMRIEHTFSYNSVGTFQTCNLTVTLKDYVDNILDKQIATYSVGILKPVGEEVRVFVSSPQNPTVGTLIVQDKAGNVKELSVKKVQVVLDRNNIQFPYPPSLSVHIYTPTTIGACVAEAVVPNTLEEVATEALLVAIAYAANLPTTAPIKVILAAAQTVQCLNDPNGPTIIGEEKWQIDTPQEIIVLLDNELELFAKGGYVESLQSPQSFQLDGSWKGFVNRNTDKITIKLQSSKLPPGSNTDNLLPQTGTQTSSGVTTPKTPKTETEKQSSPITGAVTSVASQPSSYEGSLTISQSRLTLNPQSIKVNENTNAVVSFALEGTKTVSMADGIMVTLDPILCVTYTKPRETMTFDYMIKVKQKGGGWFGTDKELAKKSFRQQVMIERNTNLVSGNLCNIVVIEDGQRKIISNLNELRNVNISVPFSSKKFDCFFWCDLKKDDYDIFAEIELTLRTPLTLEKSSSYTSSTPISKLTIT